MLKYGYGVDAPDRVRAFAWLTLAVENSNELAKVNLKEFSDLFTEQDRQKGLEHLKVIKRMIVVPGQDNVAMDESY